MARNKPQYLVDDKGRKKGMLLSIREYRKLLAKIEDLEDALELEEAVKTAEGFISHKELREELEREGLL